MPGVLSAQIPRQNQDSGPCCDFEVEATVGCASLYPPYGKSLSCFHVCDSSENRTKMNRQARSRQRTPSPDGPRLAIFWSGLLLRDHHQVIAMNHFFVWNRAEHLGDLFRTQPKNATDLT